MNFELWLFAIKRMGQTIDAAKMMFERLSEEEQEQVRKEYEAYSEANK
ncbi:MAG: hypothetical protein J5476_02055 [Lachnospiraceae bacterium]|nr:hypothetical protein [Lachnospiraceae bacterium]